jgi:hypothetical protein
MAGNGVYDISATGQSDFGGVVMIREIMNGGGTKKEKLRRLVIYISRNRGAKKAWDKRHGIVFEKHPEFMRPLDSAVRKEHRKIWEPFNRKFDDATLKICRSTSGVADPKIIPEEIFQADIEPSLNRMEEAHYLGNKSLYNRWYPDGVFPKDYLHNIDGELLDSGYNRLNPERVKELVAQMNYPVILKPNLDSWGGNEINFIENEVQLLEKMERRRNYVVQEKIRQHETQRLLHSPSLNTVRVYLYKSVKDNIIHIVNIAQRMGNGGALDNVASGGLISLVREDGRMHGYALDRYGEKYLNHPVTGLPFDRELPEFDNMKKLAAGIASKLFHLRVVGLDLCYDETGKWRAIEINTKGHSIRFAQYAGRPFFGELSEEVIGFCKKNHWAKGL